MIASLSELEFDNRAAAEAFASALRELWRRVGEKFGWREVPEARIYELAASGQD